MVQRCCRYLYTSVCNYCLIRRLIILEVRLVMYIVSVLQIHVSVQYCDGVFWGRIDLVISLRNHCLKRNEDMRTSFCSRGLLFSNFIVIACYYYYLRQGSTLTFRGWNPVCNQWPGIERKYLWCVTDLKCVINWWKARVLALQKWKPHPFSLYQTLDRHITWKVSPLSVCLCFIYRLPLMPTLRLNN